jgi:hypothetical protein
MTPCEVLKYVCVRGGLQNDPLSPAEIIEALEKKGFVIVPMHATENMVANGVAAAGEKSPPKWKGGGKPGFVQIRAAWEEMVTVGRREEINDRASGR